MSQLAKALVRLEQTSQKVAVLSQTNMIENPRGLALSDVSAELHQMSTAKTGMYLAVALRGQAQGVHGNMS